MSESGYTFKEWKIIDGSINSSELKSEFLENIVLSSNLTIVAEFEKKE